MSSLLCGLFSSCSVWVSHGSGFSCCGAWALEGSVVAACGLSGSRVLEHRLNSCGAYFVARWRMGSSWLLHWQVGSLLLSHRRIPSIYLGGSDGEASARNVGDPGSLPGSGRSPGEGNGTPLQYSCLENSMDGGAW